jgi:putative chitinase
MTNLQTKTRDALLAKGFSKKATANIMANIHAECNWKISAENMNYSGARLFALWGVGNRAGNKVRFHTRAEADALAARGPVAIGDVLYGNRMGNDANEGYKFRGRGLIQITGKENYSRYGKILGLDLVTNPDVALQESVAISLAVEYFNERKTHYDMENIQEVCQAIGHAGGPAQTAFREQLADKYMKLLNA